MLFLELDRAPTLNGVVYTRHSKVLSFHGTVKTSQPLCTPPSVTCVQLCVFSRCSRMWAQEEEDETKEFCFTELELGFLEGTHIWEVEGDPQFCLAKFVN